VARLDALLEAVALKRVARAGWVKRGVPDPESVAAHSWGVGWLVLYLLPAGLERERALAYAVIHDLAEVRVGDLTPEDGISKAEKARREHEAMVGLCADRPDLLALWEAYEAQADAESRFVRQLDRVDMAIQALAYARLVGPASPPAAAMLEFVASAEAFVTEPSLRELLAEIRATLARG
jgi:putative hydrolase of HD superfamily